MVFWDTRCVPGRTNMSIDATVMHGQRCSWFEIDGKHHFNEKECKRSVLDTEKDRILINAGYGMMRLHHKDKDQWEQFIKYHMSMPESRVQCTPSYGEYMVGRRGEPIVLSVQDVAKSSP